MNKHGFGIKQWQLQCRIFEYAKSQDLSKHPAMYLEACSCFGNFFNIMTSLR